MPSRLPMTASASSRSVRVRGPFDAQAFREALDGLGGVDTLVGEDGDDFFILTSGDESIDGGSGQDIIFEDQAGPAVEVNLATGIGMGQGSDTFASVETVVGTPFADTITGDANPNLIIPAGGADIVHAGGGGDEVDPGGGASVLDGGPGQDIVSYAGDPSPVSIDAGAGTATFGGTVSTLSGFEAYFGGAMRTSNRRG
jgi:Ca2+-binding RTX toxin-like protein